MVAMTDLEITKRCAEKMGISVQLIAPETGFNEPPHFLIPELSESPLEEYDPLHDDAQAMALVKKLDLSIARGGQATDDPWWRVTHADYMRRGRTNKDLNRAICECVAQLP